MGGNVEWNGGNWDKNLCSGSLASVNKRVVFPLTYAHQAGVTLTKNKKEDVNESGLVGISENFQSFSLSL